MSSSRLRTTRTSTTPRLRFRNNLRNVTLRQWVKHPRPKSSGQEVRAFALEGTLHQQCEIHQTDKSSIRKCTKTASTITLWAKLSSPTQYLLSTWRRDIASFRASLIRLQVRAKATREKAMSKRHVTRRPVASNCVTSNDSFSYDGIKHASSVYHVRWDCWDNQNTRVSRHQRHFHCKGFSELWESKNTPMIRSLTLVRSLHDAVKDIVQVRKSLNTLRIWRYDWIVRRTIKDANDSSATLNAVISHLKSQGRCMMDIGTYVTTSENASRTTCHSVHCTRDRDYYVSLYLIGTVLRRICYSIVTTSTLIVVWISSITTPKCLLEAARSIIVLSSSAKGNYSLIRFQRTYWVWSIQSRSVIRCRDWKQKQYFYFWRYSYNKLRNSSESLEVVTEMFTVEIILISSMEI